MARDTILLKGGGIRKEGDASTAITPGDLIQRDGSGGYKANDAAADADAPIIFALENDLVGDGIGDDYDSGDTVQALYPERGSEVYALLAYPENVQDGAALESAGDGSLQAHTAGTIVAFAKEDVDNSGAGGTLTRIRVEVA